MYVKERRLSPSNMLRLSAAKHDTSSLANVWLSTSLLAVVESLPSPYLTCFVTYT
jgi:hypothetical protein